LDADALEHLDTAAVALDHLEVHLHGVAGLELGELAALAVFDVLDHGHGTRPRVGSEVQNRISDVRAGTAAVLRPSAIPRIDRASAVGASGRSRRGGRTAAPRAHASRGTPPAACSAGTRARRRAR